MMREALATAADVLILIGLLATTLGVVGIVRMPDVYAKLHAASKAVFLGIVAFLLASMASLEGPLAAKALLTATFVLLTTPVGAHVIARAAYRRREPMVSHGAVDESGSGLARGRRAP